MNWCLHSNPFEYRAASFLFPFHFLFKAIFSFEVDLSWNTFFAKIEIFKIEFSDSYSFDALMMRDLDGIACLLSLLVGRVESIVHVVVVELDHIPIWKNINGLHYHLLGSKTTVYKLHLDHCLVVLVVDLERRRLGKGRVGGFLGVGHGCCNWG